MPIGTTSPSSAAASPASPRPSPPPRPAPRSPCTRPTTPSAAAPAPPTAPYRTNEGPHALYSGGPHWAWLRQRDLIGPLAPLPPLEAARLRFRHQGVLRRTPPFAMLKLLRRSARTGPRRPRLHDLGDRRRPARRPPAPAAHYSAVALFHHDPGSLSAAFVQERLRRATKPCRRRPTTRAAAGPSVIDRMAARAWNLGVRMETLSRVDTLPSDTPVIVATSLDAARSLLEDDSPDLDRRPYGAARPRRAHPARRRRSPSPTSTPPAGSSASPPRTAPSPRAGEQLLQGQFPIAPHERQCRRHRPRRSTCSTWPSRAGASASPGAARPSRTAVRARSTCRAPPGATARPSTARHGVYLAGDQVAAPGVLSEVSFNSAIQAARLAGTATARDPGGADEERTVRTAGAERRQERRKAERRDAPIHGFGTDHRKAPQRSTAKDILMSDPDARIRRDTTSRSRARRRRYVRHAGHTRPGRPVRRRRGSRRGHARDPARPPPLVGAWPSSRLAQLMVVLDATIVNIALPSAQRDLGITDGNRQWVITAYTLAFGGLLLLGGRIADLVGRKRTFIIGLIGFAVASATRRRGHRLRRCSSAPARSRASSPHSSRPPRSPC